MFPFTSSIYLCCTCIKSGLKAIMLGAALTSEKKRQSLLLKLSIRTVPALHYNVGLWREGIACSRCARLGAKGLHACQGPQECKSFTSVLKGGDAHPESTIYSLLPALSMRPGCPTQLGESSCRGVSPCGRRLGEGSSCSFNIISDLIIQQRNKIQNKDSNVNSLHFSTCPAPIHMAAKRSRGKEQTLMTMHPCALQCGLQRLIIDESLHVFLVFLLGLLCH